MHDAPDQLAVSMGWRLPDNSRLKVTVQTSIISYEETKDRWLVRLEDIIQPTDLTGIPADTRSLLDALHGKWAYVPDAARSGTVLPLKYETLTGSIRYFYADDPREKQA
jgi:hypothetical protein